MKKSSKFDKIHELICRPTVVVSVSGFLVMVFLFAEVGRHNYYTKELIKILEQKGEVPDELRQKIHNLNIHKTKRFLNHARKHQNKQIQLIKLTHDFNVEENVRNKKLQGKK